MPAKIIDVPDVGQLKLYKRRGATAIRLSVAANGDIKVTLPYWTTYGMATRFAASKRDWIAEQLHHRKQPPLRHRQAIGKSHVLYFVPDLSVRTPSGRINRQIVRISHPPQLEPEHHTVQSVAQKACLRALRQQAEALLPPRLAELAEEHGFTYRSINVKQLTGRWGSCDSQGNIIFNLYLMQLPWTLIDYVILHELTHTRILRHGPDFWHAMAEVLPDVKVRRVAIRHHQPVLQSGDA